jgi:hypothetical protein
MEQSNDDHKDSYEVTPLTVNNFDVSKIKILTDNKKISENFDWIPIAYQYNHNKDPLPIIIESEKMLLSDCAIRLKNSLCLCIPLVAIKQNFTKNEKLKNKVPKLKLPENKINPETFLKKVINPFDQYVIDHKKNFFPHLSDEEMDHIYYYSSAASYANQNFDLYIDYLLENTHNSQGKMKIELKTPIFYIFEDTDGKMVKKVKINNIKTYGDLKKNLNALTTIQFVMTCSHILINKTHANKNYGTKWKALEIDIFLPNNPNYVSKNKKSKITITTDIKV